MFETTYTAIETRLQSNWADTPIDFDNTPYTPVRGTPFIRLQVEWATTSNISIGGLQRGEGLVYISVFVPTDGGSRQASVLADKLFTIFSNQQDGNVKYYAPYLQRVGQVQEFYQINVLVPFASDECN